MGDPKQAAPQPADELPDKPFEADEEENEAFELTGEAQIELIPKRP